RHALAEAGKVADAGMAEPQAPRGAVAGGAGEVDDRFSGGAILHVDRQLERRAEFGVEVREPGHAQFGELAGGRFRHVAATEAPAGGAVVDEDDLAVPRHPRVRLETPGAELERAPERRQRV